MKKLQKNKTIAISAFILMLTATLITGLPIVSAQKTNVNMQITLYPIIGQDSPTLFVWMPSPNIFLSAPYEVPAWTITEMLPDAVITFTRPDGSEEVINGPFDVYWIQYSSGSVGFNPRVEYVYAPDAQGEWSVNFYWPGDDTYNAIDVTNTFEVGPHHPKRETWAMLSLRPYPAIGLGQGLLINAWVTPPPMHAYENFRGFEFTINRPDGSELYAFTADSEAPGVFWCEILPDALGNWSITMEWPGNQFYLPCSVTRYFTVQEEQIPYPVEDTPLPTEPWTYPVNVFNREWRNIAGPWLQAGYNASIASCNEYTEAPRTAHIIWKLPAVSGIGGFIGAMEENTGIGTSNIYTASVPDIRCIMAGRGYYAAGGTIYCVDIRTGETLWTAPGSGTSKFGLGAGVIGATRSRAPVIYSFGSQFRVYDALTGAMTLEVPGMSMLLFDDPYVISTQGTNLICWTTAGSSSNFASRIIWNVTSPYLDYPYSPATWPWNYVIHDGLVVWQLQRYGRRVYEDAIMEGQVAYNMTNGELVYATEIIDPRDPETWWVQQGPCRGSAYGLYYYPITGDPDQISTDSEPFTTGGYLAFDVATGDLAWKSDPWTEYPWGVFFCYNPLAAGYGMIFSLGYPGIHAINATNGEIVWTYTAGDSGMETPYNTWPFGSTGGLAGGGILFAPNTEHSPTLYYRGLQLHAVDVFTGEKVWSIQGYWNPTALAQGVLTAQDSPNGYTYAFSKGETATSVTATANTVGTGVLIQGTVLDMSPAQEGTAAISDDDMTAWMEYLHMQQPFPLDATGVDVSLDAVAPDGEFIHIGTVTSNTDGKYALSWNPPDEGTYQVIATFEGSEAYYASHDTTYVGVGPAAPQPSIPPTTAPPTTAPPTSPTAPPTTAPPTTPPASPTTPPPTSPTVAPPDTEGPVLDVYIIAAAVAIIAAVAAAAVILRRRQK